MTAPVKTINAAPTEAGIDSFKPLGLHSKNNMLMKNMVIVSVALVVSIGIALSVELLLAIHQVCLRFFR